jgi:competence protein ComEA
MSNWKSIVLGVIIGLLSTGLILLVSKPSSYSEFKLLPLPTSIPLVVYVSGGVNSPGVYQIKDDGRIVDAVQAAGGFSTKADREALNLSQKISDGEKITVPLESDAPALTPNSPEAIELININTANEELLATLPGIGLVKARDIIAYRGAHGSFTSLDELLDVKGIGAGNFDKIKELITLR